MNFLNPAAIAIAAGLTIPPLVALYFLKLKRTVRLVPSTFLWKRAVEDLQVNAPFQRLRSSLLLLLQLLILIAAAVALGKPMFQTVARSEGTIIILVDHSASMAVIEADGTSRLDQAKVQAKRCVDNMPDDARAMVIEFSDRANVVASFDTNKRALKRKIDSIDQTQSTSSLKEAMSLAEAYTQNIIIATEEAGSEKAPESAAPPATVYLFSDGRIEDADRVVLERFDANKVLMTTLGERSDNVGLLSMAARRNYEQPDVLEVTATVRNFGPEPVEIDAVLRVDGTSVDVKTIRLEAANPETKSSTDPPSSSASRDTPPQDKRTESAGAKPAVGSVQLVAFDEVEFGGGGVVEVTLRVDDALPADDRAWTILAPARHVRVLLVTEGDLFLENVLTTLPIDVVKMTGAEYERADDDELTEGDRSVFDVVIFKRHSTARLPQGNYFFWGSIPQIEGVSTGRRIDNEIIFDWDETHPILRHVAIEALLVLEWLELTLPPEAISLVDGQTSPVLAYMTRDASQFLISAFALSAEDDAGNILWNTPWAVTPDFVMFMQNAIDYLAASVATRGKKNVLPGEPVTVPLPPRSDTVTIHRPDGTEDVIPAAGFQSATYARTRQVGTYRVEPGVPGQEQFAVNLFSATESRIAPALVLTLGAAAVAAGAGDVKINQPAWSYLLLAVLVLLVLEWIIYNRRVFV